MGYRGKHSHGVDEWELPGGKPDLWESMPRAAAREAKEEVDVDIEEGSLDFLTWTDDRFPSHGRHFITLYFYTTRWSGTPRICEPHKCLFLKWFKLTDIPSNSMAGTRTAGEALHRYLASQTMEKESVSNA